MLNLSAATETLLTQVGQIDWRNMESISGHASPILAQLAQPHILRELIGNLAHRKDYWPKCEREYGLTKFVLHADSQDRFRLRLHVMKLAPEETPHSHRMNFITRLLCGGYMQRLYSPDDDGKELMRPEQINCVMRHYVNAGNGYVLKHTVVHSLEVLHEPCVSLMIRGSTIKDQAVNIDIRTNEVWWQRGDEYPAHHSSVKLEMPQEIESLMSLLDEQHLI